MSGQSVNISYKYKNINIKRGGLDEEMLNRGTGIYYSSYLLMFTICFNEMNINGFGLIAVNAALAQLCMCR